MFFILKFRAELLLCRNMCLSLYSLAPVSQERPNTSATRVCIAHVVLFVALWGKVFVILQEGVCGARCICTFQGHFFSLLLTRNVNKCKHQSWRKRLKYSQIKFPSTSANSGRCFAEEKFKNCNWDPHFHCAILHRTVFPRWQRGNVNKNQNFWAELKTFEALI